jgi:hypothetical protein
MKLKYWHALGVLTIAVGAIMQYFGYHTPVVPLGVVIGGIALAGYVRRLENKGKAQTPQKR